MADPVACVPARARKRCWTRIAAVTGAAVS